MKGYQLIFEKRVQMRFLRAQTMRISYGTFVQVINGEHKVRDSEVRVSRKDILGAKNELGTKMIHSVK